MSIYPAGQCTDGAANAAPWVQRYGNLGDALKWAANWRSHGGDTTGTPTDGSVFCCQPGNNGAGGYGHVGVVDGVTLPHFQVKEMNFGANESGFGHYEVNIRTLVEGPGVEFLLEAAPAKPAPPPPMPAGGQYANVDGAEASALGRIHLFFKDSAGRMVPFGSEPMPLGGSDPLYKWEPSAPPQHFRFLWVDPGTASRLGRTNLWYQKNGQYVQFDAAAGTAPLFQRLRA